MTGQRFSSTPTGKRLFKALSHIFILFTGLLIGIAFGLKWHVHSSEDRKEMRLGGYQFINPLLECEVEGSQVEFSRLIPFKDKIKLVVEQRISRKEISNLAVYFRDLNNGPWFGIDERALFSPASLLKIPVMISILKEAEAKPEFLSKKIRYTGNKDHNEQEVFKPQFPIERGKSYTIDELLLHSIADSDNNANALLSDAVSSMHHTMTYRNLGIPKPSKGVAGDFMSVKEYASFFRVLFNASYLSKEMSEKALGYLSKSSFRQGIVAGVPDDVVVANKFGERIYSEQPGIKQLHDCGIVYYPDNPYLLCIMSRGKDYAELAKVISIISTEVYKEVDSQSRNLAVR